MTRKSGLADSPLFHTAPPPPPTGVLRSENNTASEKHKNEPPSEGGKKAKQQEEEKSNPSKQPERTTRGHDTTKPRHLDTTPPTTVSRYHDTVVEVVRRAVKEFGKEAATHRFTLEEKKAIAEVLYTYQRQGVRTSENEITRIAVNFILDDYRQHGESSLLDRVLKALNE